MNKNGSAGINFLLVFRRKDWSYRTCILLVKPTQIQYNLPHAKPAQNLWCICRSPYTDGV